MDQTTGWLVNNEGPYRINSIRNGILTGYTATVNNSNLIVENIMMNDVRNGSEYRCVVIMLPRHMGALDMITDVSDPTILYVAGEYQNCTVISHYCIGIKNVMTTYH